MEEGAGGAEDKGGTGVDTAMTFGSFGTFATSGTSGSASGDHTRTCISASMARCRWSRCRGIMYGSQLQRHDQRIFALPLVGGVIVFTFTHQMKTIATVHLCRAGVALSHFEPQSMRAAPT